MRECEGKRFQPGVLEYELGGKDLSEVLAMPVAEAAEFCGSAKSVIVIEHHQAVMAHAD